MKDAITAVYAAIVSLLVVVVYEHFVKHLGWSGVPAVLGAAALGSALLLIYEMIVRSRFLARRLSPIYHVEGTWKISLTNHERPTSICKIRFARRNYVYSGFGINSDGTRGSTWTSRDVHYDEDQDEFSFTSDADLVSGGRVRNYGYVHFSRNADGKFDSGMGYFVDMAETLSQSHMTLVRIEASEFDSIYKSTFGRTRTKDARAQGD